MDHSRLLADIGGTHARFAWQAGVGAPLTDESVLTCDDHAHLWGAISHYLDARGGARPAACGLGIATPITGDQVRMTNRDWSFSQAELKERLGVRTLRVLNDFEAVALALPTLNASELRPIGAGQPIAGAPRAVIGPGTGLGVATWVSGPAGEIAVAGEGGHVTLAAANDEEAEVIARLRQRFEHVSAERVLSGPGLVHLHAVAIEMTRRAPERGSVPDAPPDMRAVDVVRGAGAGPADPDADPCCARALEWFFAFLGGVAGNLALTVGARGGVYLAGGIVPRIVDALDRSCFRQRFEAKGRYRSYLAEIPVWVINTPSSPALRGAARALDQIQSVAAA
jgi:glucokinase